MLRLYNTQEALLTVTARVPDTEQYRDFSDEVKRIARDEFNYTYDEDPVNPFVAAFHEAVLLYSIVSILDREIFEFLIYLLYITLEFIFLIAFDGTILEHN